MKCAQTVTAVIIVVSHPFTLKFRVKVMHTRLSLLPLLILHYISIPFILPSCGHYPAMSVSTGQEKAHLK